MDLVIKRYCSSFCRMWQACVENWSRSLKGSNPESCSCCCTGGNQCKKRSETFHAWTNYSSHCWLEHLAWFIVRLMETGRIMDVWMLLKKYGLNEAETRTVLISLLRKTVSKAFVIVDLLDHMAIAFWVYQVRTVCVPNRYLVIWQ